MIPKNLAQALSRVGLHFASDDPWVGPLHARVAQAGVVYAIFQGFCPDDQKAAPVRTGFCRACRAQVRVVALAMEGARRHRGANPNTRRTPMSPRHLKNG